MRMPRSHNLFRQVIRLNRQEYDVERPVGSPSGEVNNFGGTPKEEEPDEFVQLLWLYDPGEEYAQEEFGVRLNGDLHALAIPEDIEGEDALDEEDAEPFNLQANDRLDHGDEKYAVETVIFLPNEDRKEYAVIELVRMDNEP